MADLKPLPMKDIVNPAPMHPASEKMSQWMNSYMPTVMNKVMAGSVAPTNLGMGNEGGAGLSNMLFQSIHPDTFERVLNFIKPTPRQEGGTTKSGEEYIVGEKGPEIFKPNVPGNIIPNNVATGELPAPLPSQNEKILSPVGGDSGQLNSVPGYIARFLVDVGRVALGLPEGGTQQPLPMGPTDSMPSQGYRIAEGGKPEVVNAEGAYFPFEKGQVTPLESRQGGGEVEPLLGMAAYEASARKMRGLPAMAPGVNPPTGMPEYEESAARMRAPSSISTISQSLPMDQTQPGLLPLGWNNAYGSGGYSQRRIPLFPMQVGGNVIPGGPGIPIQYEDIDKKPLEMKQGPTGTYELPGEEGTMTVGPQRFFAGGKEVPMDTPGAVSGDELARQKIFRQTPPGGFYSPVTGTVRPEDLRIPQRGYYEAHPEERQAEIAMELMPRLGGKEKFADVYKALSEYGAPGKAPAPHLVQNESGEYVWATPGAILPAGVKGKGPVGTRLQSIQEDKGDMYRSGTFNPDTGERQMGEWQKKGPGPIQPVESKMDLSLVTKTISQMPKLKSDAITASNSLKNVDRALELVSRGVTGKGGQFKAWIAPYAELVGYSGENLSDSQTFQLFTRVLIGPMRLDLVGSGPVSDYEQKLMKTLSGGGGAVKAAAIELLNYYRNKAQMRIDNYHQTLEGLTNVYPKAGEIYKPIEPSGGTVDIMPEQTAREALRVKGIVGTEQDTWIDTYKKAGKVK